MISDPSDVFNANGEPYCSSAPCTASDVPHVEETSAGPATGMGTLDETIQEAIDSISEDCSPSALDAHVRALAQKLFDYKASGLVILAAFNLLNKRLGDLGLATIGKREWGKILQEIAATDAVNHPNTTNCDDPQAIRTLVHEILPDAPVSDNAVVPPGWRLTPAGVFQIGAETVGEVLPVPLVIKARLLDDVQQTESVRLSASAKGF